MSDVSKKQTLMQIIAEAEAHNQELLNNLGELTPDLESAIDINESNFQQKIDNIYFRIKGLQGVLATLEDTQKQVTSGVRELKSAIKKMKWLVELGMKIMELKQVTGNYSKFTLTKTKQKVVITDPEKIPLNLTRAKTEISPDLEAIYDYLSKGGTLEGAHLEDNYYLRATGNNIKTVKDVEATPEIESPGD